jgi:transposase-like protein
MTYRTLVRNQTTCPHCLTIGGYQTGTQGNAPREHELTCQSCKKEFTYFALPTGSYVMKKVD